MYGQGVREVSLQLQSAAGMARPEPGHSSQSHFADPQDKDTLYLKLEAVQSAVLQSGTWAAAWDAVACPTRRSRGMDADLVAPDQPLAPRNHGRHR